MTLRNMYRDLFPYRFYFITSDCHLSKSPAELPNIWLCDTTSKIISRALTATINDIGIKTCGRRRKVNYQLRNERKIVVSTLNYCMSWCHFIYDDDKYIRAPINIYVMLKWTEIYIDIYVEKTVIIKSLNSVSVQIKYRSKLQPL